MRVLFIQVFFPGSREDYRAKNKISLGTLRGLLIEYLSWAVIIAAYIAGLFIPLMNNDSAHHANIALRMYETGDFINLIDRGHDYLDKPHLLFWLSALSYKIFGVHPFAYKFPSFLFSILAVYSTYQLAVVLYNREVARRSAAILCTAYAFFLATNDVRMDAILTGSIIFATWQLIRFVNTKSFVSLVLGALGLSLGFATKGIIGIVLPLLSLFLFIFFRRSWKDLLDKRWLVFAILLILFLSPVFYCFYLQFDLHPEKVIRGSSGHSGISFLILGQSIQRYTGSGWGTNGDSDYLFFVHTFLWAFLPWSLTACFALWKSSAWQIKSRFAYSAEQHAFIPSTIVIMLLILSVASFKLPHYLNILFPFVSISTAAFIKSAAVKWQKVLFIFQGITIVLILAVALALDLWSFPPDTLAEIAVPAVLFALLIVQFRTEKGNYTTPTLIATALLYFVLNISFYPSLLHYQSGNTLAQTLGKKNLTQQDIGYLEGHELSNSFDFHLGRLIPARTINSLRSTDHPLILYTGPSGLAEITSAGIRYQLIDSAADTRVSKLSMETLDPRKRKKIRNFHYLIRVFDSDSLQNHSVKTESP